MEPINTKQYEARRLWPYISIIVLCISIFLSTANLRADEATDLNNAVDALGNEVAVTTTTEGAAVGLIKETNMTQSALLVAGFVNATHGSNVDLPITLIPGPDPVAGLQFNIAVPSGVSISSVTVGSAASLAGKSLQFSTSTLTGIIFGLNQTEIGDGVVAIAHLKTTGTGIFPITLTEPAASDASGIEIPLCLTSGVLRLN